MLSILDEVPASNIQPLLTLEEIYKCKPRKIKLSLKEMNNNKKKKEDTGNMSLKSYFFQVIEYFSLGVLFIIRCIAMELFNHGLFLDNRIRIIRKFRMKTNHLIWK